MLPLKSLDDIDWANWTPQQVATLLLIVQDGKILLIRKKRGLGAGKVNGPGGRLDPGETPWQAAIRETQEELHITPTDVRAMGELSFQFVDGLSIHVYVFRAGGFEGEPTETDEAVPLWVDLDEIPYDEMWTDDQYWLPLLLADRPFEGQFLFDKDTMLDRRLKTL